MNRWAASSHTHIHTQHHPTSLAGYSLLAVNAWAKLNLHVGHVDFSMSHVSMHSTWNWWKQLKRRTSWLSLKLSKQIEHLVDDDDPQLPLLPSFWHTTGRLYLIMGKRAIMDRLRPLVAVCWQVWFNMMRRNCWELIVGAFLESTKFSCFYNNISYSQDMENLKNFFQILN